MSEQNKQGIPNNYSPILPAHLTPKSRANKVDLSYVNPQLASTKSWERRQNQSESPQSVRPSSPAGAFRSNKGLRSILAAYIESGHVPGVGDTKDFTVADPELLHLFSDDVLEFLRSKGYEPVDVASWAWIFNSDSVSQSVDRFVALADDLRKQNKSAIPRFVVLQLLRADFINAAPLQALLSTLRRAIEEHPLHVVEEDGLGIIDIEEKRAKAWDYASAMILAVRLLRHARLIAPDLMHDITELAGMMLFSLRTKKADGFGRLTYMCNRLLSLISLPTSVNPMRSVRSQQKAHLALLHRMFAQQPQVPITREGYQALIKLQLIHDKTDEERSWALAKSEGWPPWQKSKTGMDDNLEYPGKESRAMKMLRRMTEAGYTNTAWEKAAAIFAGWDTDKSPTIQSRAILDLPPMQAFVSFFDAEGDDAPLATALLWTARISATRSVREAWACFTEYRKTVKEANRRIDPYHAMFEKLLARPRDGHTGSNVLPGDAKETWEDPASHRDLLYLETDIPSTEGFYNLMSSDEVRPAGRLLSLLVHNAETVDEGTRYLQRSRYTEFKKDLLLKPSKYPDSVIRDTVSSIPDHFLAPYLGLLTRAHRPGHLDGANMLSRTSSQKAFELLFKSETPHTPAYNAVLQGLCMQLKALKQTPSSSKQRLRHVADLTKAVVNQMARLDIQPDLATFHGFSSILRLFLKPPTSWCLAPPIILGEIKRLFTTVVYASHKHSWVTTTASNLIIKVPDPEHLRLLVEVLGMEQDIAGLLELADWMGQHADRLKENYGEMASGERTMKKALFGLRVFLEGAWASSHDWDMGISTATEEQMVQNCSKLEALGWPTTEQMTDFIDENHSWLDWLRKVIWSRRNLAAKATTES